MRKVDKENLKKPFGGKVVVLGGDFGQILHMLLEKVEAQIPFKQSLIMHWFEEFLSFWCLLKICGWKVIVQHTTLQLKLKILLIAFWNLEGDESGTSQIDIPEELSIASFKEKQSFLQL